MNSVEYAIAQLEGERDAVIWHTVGPDGDEEAADILLADGNDISECSRTIRIILIGELQS